MFEKFRQIHTRLSYAFTAWIVMLLVVFGIVVGVIGSVEFTTAFKEENSTTTHHIANTAAVLVNGDHIDEYLRGEETEEYARSKKYLDNFCKKMHVSLVYVIEVDTSDYGRFVSVFNSVDNSVDDSSYTEWEIGHKRDTTNEEYRKKYQALYEKRSEFETVYRFNPGPGLHPHITTIVPVTDSENNVSALLCVQRPISELVAVVRRFVLHLVIFALILTILAAHLASRFSHKSLIEPISKVSEEAARFARENTKGEELGEVSRFNEISTLAKSIDKMETDMVTYVDHLTVFTAERERTRTEMSFAWTIQHSSLPTTFPAFPDRHDFDIYASMTPAKEVGGDFYGFRLIDDDHLAMWIGDVSDKGVPAALFMMSANIVINNRTSMGGTPAEIMGFVNNNICEHNLADMFVTIWLGILELSTGRLTFVNAGHEDPAVYHKGGSFELFKTKHNLFAGSIRDIEYTDCELQLGKGDKVFLYTDGVPEATDADDKMFTLSRMTEALNLYREEAPQAILEGVHKSVNEFVGDRKQFDDLTMLCVELK